MKQRTLIFILVLVLVMAAGFLTYQTLHAPTAEEDEQNVEEPVVTDVVIPEDIQAHINSKADLIRLTSPTPLSTITSPLTLKGEARGYWFFEASFPIVLVNWDGLIIAEGFATADGEWMTEDFVPLTATLTFTKPDFDERGAIILQRDNPSGLPENDDALEIPIRFEP